MTTKDKYIQKLEELVESFRNSSNRYYMWSSMPVIYKQDIDPLIDKFESELSSLKAEMEKEDGYKIEINKPNSMLTGWVCPRCQTVHGPFTTSCGCPPPTITRSSTDATF